MIALMMCLTTQLFSQELLYSDLKNEERPKGTYESYLSKDNILYKVGDTIKINTPSGTNGKFVYIQKIDIMLNEYGVGVKVNLNK